MQFPIHVGCIRGIGFWDLQFLSKRKVDVFGLGCGSVRLFRRRRCVACAISMSTALSFPPQSGFPVFSGIRPARPSAAGDEK
jgi:hypothetical protein